MPESPLNQFQAFLEQLGKRLTRDRRLVAETVFALAPPFDDATVIAAVRKKFTSEHRVRRSIIYLTLSLLVGSELVRIQTSENVEPVYFHSFAPGQAGTLLSLCETTHSKLIAGTCPWCGCDIIRGKLRDDFR